MHFLKILLVLLMSVAALPAVAGPYEDAVAAYDKRDFAKATLLMRQLAEQGVALAQYQLGFWYSTGIGLKQDDASATLWLRKAAEQGYAPAQNELGTLYRTGKGVPQDYATAAIWYRKAAEQGYAYAQRLLGTSYRDGKGVTQDYVQAYMWFDLAAPSAPIGLGTIQRDDIAAKMTPAQIAEAQELARQWRPSRSP